MNFPVGLALSLLIMSVFYFVSLPASAAPSGGDPETQLEKWYMDNLNVSPSEVSQFSIPVFKIGTLDSLVQQSEELAKLDAQFHGVVAKLSDIIGNIYEGNQSKIISAKKVDGSMGKCLTLRSS